MGYDLSREFVPKNVSERCFEPIVWTAIGGNTLQCGAYKRRNGTCPNQTHHRARMAAPK